MNVCLLNDSFPPVIDGVANVIMNYARILEEAKLAEVTVATPAYPDVDYSGYPYRVVPYRSFDTTKIVDGYRAGNPFDVSELQKLVDTNPDIIHTHCPVASTIMARLLKARTGAPLIFTYHTKFDIDIARAFKSKALQETAIKALVSNIEACDEVWVVSEGAGENLRSLGYTGDYIVMSNGVDFAKGRAEEAFVREVTQGYDLPEGVPVFLFVGRIITYKGLPLILDALAKLEENNFEYRMVFVGGGPDAEAVQEKARELKLKHCIFTGPVRDRQILRAWNTRADLFLFPSTFDTNGIVVREAAACGLASVLIKGSCAAEGITDGRNGFLIEETAESMAALLMEKGNDPKLLRTVGQCAMDEIYISWDDSVKAAYERYRIIMENRDMGMYETKLHLLEEQLRQHRQELAEYRTALKSESVERIESAREWARTPFARLEESLEDMRSDMDTMMSNAVQAVDDRVEAMHQRYERLKKWRAGLIESVNNRLDELLEREEDES